MLASAWSRCLTSFLLAASVVGCGTGFYGDGTTSLGPTIGDGDFGDGDGDTGDSDGGTGTTTAAPTRSVDVLFVVDNSGSMGEEQISLALAADVLIAELEAADADYRIGVTTTDSGNPWCPSGTTTPEAGNLVLSSCKSRLGDFVFNNGEVDVGDIACNDICLLDNTELQIQPTTTDVDPVASPRPWVQSIDGQTNLPPGTNVAEALRCFLPQGINGCGFESQLESMYLALIRAQSADEASYGFTRPDAVLAVVFLTDEADCSYNTSFAEIFEQDGNKVFWSDPTDSFPTSAVCWNAGVRCTGDPSNYTSCDPINKDVNGQEGVSDANAVLHPLSRYIGLLDGFQQVKQALDPNREIVVAVIGGVQSDGTPFYADVGGTEPQFQYTFGIGPGCEAANPNDPGSPTQAVPPVRMREVSDTFSPGSLYSICDSNYASPMSEVAQKIVAQF
ncbi:vWA domain-containing protein [Enhygromyxa salina]|uniref:VWFA domain-containing protein n=1 Tax=Enhygromyxa salina TaxID=215803 RepID=A0A2S9XTT5_9BACT|nr:vWA domain-containing protein [Enhygromyxa salina]PRP96276.1 hypothetical protein ENSA7_70910 [Enhygromyxa salina]